MRIAIATIGWFGVVALVVWIKTTGHWWLGVIAVAVGLVATVASFWPSFREARRLRRYADARCPACGYDLHGRFDLACPECGWKAEDEPPRGRR